MRAGPRVALDWPAARRGRYLPAVSPPLFGARPGMTIVEVVFAILILAGVTLAMATFGQAFSRASSSAGWFALASDLASSRLEAIRAEPTYSALAAYAGTETSATTTAVPSMSHAPGFTRVTAVQRDSTSGHDWTRVTVTISAAQLTTVVTKSMTVAKP